MCGREGDVWGEEDVCGREEDVCGREEDVCGREMCVSLTPAIPPTHRISIHHTPSTRDTYVLILIL